MSSEKYCFSVPAQAAARKFSAVQVPSDVVTEDGNCLIIQMRPHRRELIQRYLLSSLPGASIAFSSEDIRKEPCRLKIEKVKRENTHSTNIGLNRAQVGAEQSDSKGSATSVMQIETLKEFQFSVDQDEILGHCRYINPKRYEISLEVRQNPKPIVPTTLPPGTIVILKEPPPDQKTMSLKTELQLNRGERIEVGKIVRNLIDKENSVDINPALKSNRTNQSSTEKIFLSLQ